MANDEKSNTDQSTTYNYGRTKQQITLNFVKWILGVALAVGLAWGTLLTKNDADALYVRKEVQEKVNQARDQQLRDIKESLMRIEQKVDEHMSGRNRK